MDSWSEGDAEVAEKFGDFWSEIGKVAKFAMKPRNNKENT
jgi:hypothetical protein